MQTKRFVLVWLAFTAAASAQNFVPKKDAAFGQVVVGGGYETVINLTNRGTHSYFGTLSLFRIVNEASVPWNPTVNGVAGKTGNTIWKSAAGHGHASSDRVSTGGRGRHSALGRFNPGQPH